MKKISCSLTFFMNGLILNILRHWSLDHVTSSNSLFSVADTNKVIAIFFIIFFYNILSIIFQCDQPSFRCRHWNSSTTSVWPTNVYIGVLRFDVFHSKRLFSPRRNCGTTIVTKPSPKGCKKFTDDASHEVITIKTYLYTYCISCSPYRRICRQNTLSPARIYYIEDFDSAVLTWCCQLILLEWTPI